MTVAPQDRPLPGSSQVGLRVFKPERRRAVYLHFHPGGFLMGSPAMSDSFNSRVAAELSIAVVSVDYRLAPRWPMPAAADDGESAALWLIENSAQEFGTERLLIGGESAGASLSVLTLLRLRKRRVVERFRAANLSVGNYDFSGTPSQRRAPDSYFLSPARLRATVDGAFPGLSPEALRDPAISSLYADLEDLPPAIFSVGTADSVLDDSLFLAARWRAAGNEAELHVYPDGTHLFLNEPTPLAAEGNRRILEFLDRHA